ncbi:hypothetical protein RSOLAG1IB_09926 [Rhizoctonia solani AG-1 IB]|uniref:A-kinase anchor protein 7-like phosphoesterase domain-containing protein n=1 Tax=Thanatephorus cucumeris (strain AG1-IB / isolate 7/3/14) TaxID=1108050 RepID=A0A0B7FWP1_THACB|nr:hypothetical protein RSOLAG1IB_09926 [Rhizoctonia solani AG-1 IB]
MDGFSGICLARNLRVAVLASKMAEATGHTNNHLGRRENRGDPKRPWKGRGGTTASPIARERPTHFISIPLDHVVSFTTQVSQFTDTLLAASPPITGLDRSIIISPNRLHLTLGVMNLTTEEHESRGPLADSSQGGTDSKSSRKTVAEALALLHSLKPYVESTLQGQPLQLCLDEFAVMKRSPSGEADVMYVGPTPGRPKAEEHTRSVDVITNINKTFIENGFITDTRPLKLHCTVINTSHRKTAQGGRTRRTPFSMSQIEEFLTQNPHTAGTLLSPEGLLSIRELNICRMGSRDKFGRYVKAGGIAW